MEERFAHVERAVADLEAENRRLRQEVEGLQARVSTLEQEVSARVERLEQGMTALQDPLQEAEAEDAATPSGQWKGRLRRRWPLVAVALTIAVPLVALSVWHLDAFWSTAIAFLNGLLLYYIGPRAWALLIEGLFRAIPGVLFGQATRIAVDRFRKRRKASG